MSAPPWVLLRGLMRDSRHWGDFTQAFSAALPGARVLTLDLPGNGALNLQRSPASIPAMARWCRAELLRRGHAPPYRLFAMSLGAMVAIDWAQRHAADLQGAVLVNTSLRPFSPAWQRLRPAAYGSALRMALARSDARDSEGAILRLTSRHRTGDTALIDRWTAWREAQPVSTANALRQLLAAACFQPPRTRPDVPLLLLTSQRDRLVDTRCSQALAQAWGCELARHPTAGHDLPLDDAAWTAAQVRRWAAELAAA